MTITLAPQQVQSEIKDALLAYLDALTLAEPIQARLWQEAEITLTQLSVLRELREGPQTAGRLADALGISATSVTRLVDRLERRALVGRRREADDRRCVEIHLAPAGERLLGEIRVLRGTDLHGAVGSMTGAERRRLTVGLRRLVELARARSAAAEGTR
jgi:DNA-binding MarR family transcriptional regulator